MAPVALTGRTGNTTSTISASATSLAGDAPGNLANDDLLWAVFYHRNNGASLTAPSGWELAKSENSLGSFGAWVKPITDAASEPATYTFGVVSGTNRCLLLIGRITGADLVDPVDAVGVTSGTSGTSSLVHPQVTAVTAGCLLLTVSTNNRFSTTPAVFTADAAMSQVEQTDADDGSSSDVQVAQELLVSAGATGTRTASISPDAASSIGFMVAIKSGAPPATSAPPPGLRPQNRNLLIR